LVLGSHMRRVGDGRAVIGVKDIKSLYISRTLIPYKAYFYFTYKWYLYIAYCTAYCDSSYTSYKYSFCKEPIFNVEIYYLRTVST
jgi:hypothetical protein